MNPCLWQKNQIFYNRGPRTVLRWMQRVASGALGSFFLSSCLGSPWGASSLSPSYGPIISASQNDVVVLVRDEIVDLSLVQNEGQESTYCSSEPSPPVGLALSSNCTLKGSPSELSEPTVYTLTAYNPQGRSSTQVQIAVIDTASNETSTGGGGGGGSASCELPSAHTVCLGTTLQGVTGTAICQSGTASSAASTAHVLSGREFWGSAGNKLTGTMANHGAVTIDSVSDTLSAGFLSSLVISAGDLLAGNICSGNTILGIAGTAVCQGAAGTGSVISEGTVCDGSYGYDDDGLAIEGAANCNGLVTTSTTHGMFEEDSLGKRFLRLPTSTATWSYNAVSSQVLPQNLSASPWALGHQTSGLTISFSSDGLTNSGSDCPTGCHGTVNYGWGVDKTPSQANGFKVRSDFILRIDSAPTYDYRMHPFTLSVYNGQRVIGLVIWDGTIGLMGDYDVLRSATSCDTKTFRRYTLEMNSNSVWVISSPVNGDGPTCVTGTSYAAFPVTSTKLIRFGSRSWGWINYSRSWTLKTISVDVL
jgi:hypothetical protein